MVFEANKDNERERLEKQNQEKDTKKSLLDFWENEENDKKLLNNPKWWNKAITMMKDDIVKKSKEINDPESEKKINDLTKVLDWYTKLWKLNKEQAEKLSDIYKQINSIEATNHAEDAKWWEEVKNSINKSKNDYAKKLLDATESLDKFLKNNHEEAMDKQKQSSEKMHEARTNQKEPLSSYESLEVPPSQKNPKEKSPEAIV